MNSRNGNGCTCYTKEPTFNFEEEVAAAFFMQQKIYSTTTYNIGCQKATLCEGEVILIASVLEKHCCNGKDENYYTEEEISGIRSSSNVGSGENRENLADDQEDEAEVDDVVIITGDREKLKETDEYKKAMEQEWSSRQQVLQIQAKEAQKSRRLLKRENAEARRLRDMEKRQKQRVEEIRINQKKDEDRSILKEIIRAQVKKELYQVEVECGDMASLLQRLGMAVYDGVLRSQNEVHSAYKRALLAFHPDRISTSDIRQQVEAEEKFKLAKEAQKSRRLLKRENAEARRLRDMEKRQKERVEEIRINQKKDEDRSILKEIIRAQVKKELYQVEVECGDMASLLQRLGMAVYDGVLRSQNEVHSAYKRALLAFHPDRISTSDIRQQVEAEEKFKLVRCMKDKLLPS